MAGYTGITRASYPTDLRLFAAWCADNWLRLFEVRRVHLEMFARAQEQEGRMRLTVARPFTRVDRVGDGGLLVGEYDHSAPCADTGVWL